MIDFYAMGSPNVVKIYLALEELGLPYTVHPVDVFGGKQYTVFESGAILLYLAEKTGKLLPADRAARFDAIQWMMVQMTTVGPMFGQYVHFMRFAPKGNDYALSRYLTQVHRALEAIEARLGEAPYLGGSEYSIADIATVPWARIVPALLGAPAAQQYPKVTAWAEKIAARPAAAKAFAAADEVRGKVTGFDKAAPEALDRMFGRCQFAAA